MATAGRAHRPNPRRSRVSTRFRTAAARSPDVACSQPLTGARDMPQKCNR